MASSTVITIAHRLEAVRDADSCIVLKNGRVAEEGVSGKMVKREVVEGEGSASASASASASVSQAEGD